MALTKPSMAVNIITSLATTSADRGLTDDQFKAKFDETPAAIKTYLNDTLTVEVDANFRLKVKRVTTEASNATPTPDVDACDIHTITAQAGAAAFAIPAGTPTEGQALIIRIKDNGTARALTWNAIYRAVGAALPTTTVISKTMYIGFIYNNTDTKWDCIATQKEA